MATSAKRHSAEERREEILDAAIVEFAQRGLDGTSTEQIARRAGISQPYVFRLFGTKKELFVETVRRCFRETLETFREAAARAEPGDELPTMGRAYVELLEDRNRLRVQMHAYMTDDPDVREVVRAQFGEVFLLAEEVSGATTEEVAAWLAHGMLLNVVAAIDLGSSRAEWARRLVAAVVKA